MAFVEGCQSGKLPGRPEARTVRNEEQNQLIFDRVVSCVHKRNSKAYSLKASSEEPNA